MPVAEVLQATCTRAEFYRKYGVSLEVHYGPGIHNGCRGLLDGHKSHSIGCTGEERVPEDIKAEAEIEFDRHIAHPEDPALCFVGREVVNIPEQVDYDQQPINPEDNCPMAVYDIRGYRLVVRDDGMTFAAAPATLAWDIVAFEERKRQANVGLLEAYTSSAKAMGALSHMSGAQSLAARMEAVRSELESIRVATLRLYKEQ
jgi:hypothetical protein